MLVGLLPKKPGSFERRLKTPFISNVLPAEDLPRVRISTGKFLFGFILRHFNGLGLKPNSVALGIKPLSTRCFYITEPKTSEKSNAAQRGIYSESKQTMRLPLFQAVQFRKSSCIPL